MKVKLLNDGGYGDMENVRFPVEIDARPGANSGYVLITRDELYRVGATAEKFDVISRYAFLTGDHVEMPE